MKLRLMPVTPIRVTMARHVKRLVLVMPVHVQLVSLGLTAQRESITVLMSLVPMVVHATILQEKLLVAVCLGLRDYDVKSISTSVILVHVAMEVAA